MNRGEVWWAELDPVRGSEQAGRRPVMILQSDALNAFLWTVIVIPFTTNLQWAQFPFCVMVPAGEGGLVSDSIALCHQIHVMDRIRLTSQMGQVSEETLNKIEQALQVALDM